MHFPRVTRFEYASPGDAVSLQTPRVSWVEFSRAEKTRLLSVVRAFHASNVINAWGRPCSIARGYLTPQTSQPVYSRPEDAALFHRSRVS